MKYKLAFALLVFTLGMVIVGTLCEPRWPSNDITDELQRAFDSGASKIYIGPGEYQIHGMIVVSRDVSIAGTEQSTVVWIPEKNSHNLILHSCTKCEYQRTWLDDPPVCAKWCFSLIQTGLGQHQYLPCAIRRSANEDNYHKE